MKEYIGKYDTIDEFLALIELLEIKGDNPMIKAMQENAIRLFKQENKSFDSEWVMMMTLRARKEAKESKV